MLDNHLHRFCGGRYQRAVETVTLRLSGMSAEVERELYRCSKCADEQRTVEQREAAERAAVEHIRAANALLSPREIRQLRESLGLTPAQLGELLYGTPRGIVEGWEKGRYLQNREADALLRSLRDRETLERRAAKAGVTLPMPELLAAASPANAPTAVPNAAPAAATPASDAATSGAHD
jgi:putative zinc finger/helix-turn-helix YgiT family protein